MTSHNLAMTTAAVIGLLASGTARAQVQVEVRSPSEAFQVAFDRGDMAAALKEIEPAARGCVGEAGGAEATVAGMRPCVTLLTHYALTLSSAGQTEKAIAVAQTAVAVAADFGADSDIAIFANLALGLTLEQQGRHAQAEQPFRVALEGAEKTLGGADLAVYLARRGSNLTMLARFADALPLIERAIRLAGDGVDGNFFRLMQGRALIGEGRFAEAEAALRTGAARLAALTGPQSPETLSVRETLALCLEAQNRSDEAIPIYREILAFRRTQGTSPGLADTLSGLGAALRRVGDMREAETVLREALTVRLAIFGERSTFTALAYANVGTVLMEVGDLDAAAAMLNRAVESFRGAGAFNPDEYFVVINNLATVLHRSGAFKEASGFRRQLVGYADQAFGSGHARSVLARLNLAAALMAQGEHAETRQLLEAAYRAAGSLGGAGAQYRAQAASGLGELHRQAGAGAEAELWFRRAEMESRSAFRADHAQRIGILRGYGRFLITRVGGLPLARTLLSEAGRQVLVRTSAGTGFDGKAQRDLSTFSSVFRDQVRAAWSLSQPAS